MKYAKLTAVVMALFLAAAMPGAAKAEEDKHVKEWTDADMAKYEKTAQAVFAKLLAKVGTPDVKNWEMITLTVVDYFPYAGGKDYLNAGASCDSYGIPQIRITRDYLWMMRGDENALALILAHEIGHHVLGHTFYKGVYKTPTQSNIESHKREADADKYGAKLMMDAKFSILKGSRALYAGMSRMGGLYSSADGCWYTHPGRTDRLTRIANLMKSPELALWRNMAAFENGNTMMRLEDFAAAESCFLSVTQEFPDCAEAWANLGMARLLRYCDSLSAADLSRLGVGQFIAGVRFHASASLLTIRGGSESLLRDAVIALEKARTLMPNSATILVGLGVASLVDANGLTNAERLFAQALALVEAGDSDLDPATQIALRMNRGVAQIAAGKPDAGQAHIAQAQTLAAKWKGYASEELVSAALFNKAVALSMSGQKAEAVHAFEQYLRTNSPTNLWWSVAFDRYTKLNESLGEEPLSRASLSPKAKTTLRRHIAIRLPSGKFVHLGEPMAKVREDLGSPKSEVSDKVTSLKRLDYPSEGVVIIADDDEVHAVMIAAGSPLAIELREAGNGGRIVGEIRIGMSRQQVEALPGGNDWLSRPFTNLALDYPYYPELGVAVVYDGEGPDAKVKAIIIGALKGGEPVCN